MHEYALSEGKKYKMKPYTLTTLIFFLSEGCINNIFINEFHCNRFNFHVNIQYPCFINTILDQMLELARPALNNCLAHTHTLTHTHTNTHCYDNKCRCHTRIASLSLKICKILIHVISKYFLKLLFKRLQDLYYTTKLILHLVFTI